MSWCASLPLVDIPEGDTPKPVTLVYPYFENAQFLRTQIGWWETYPDYLKAYLSAVIVDDGSPTTPAENVLFGLNQPFPIRLYRIEEDRAWNWLAARNIGAHASFAQMLLGAKGVRAFLASLGYREVSQQPGNDVVFEVAG